MADRAVSTSRSSADHRRRGLGVAWSWQQNDHHPNVTIPATLVVVIAVGMALFGLPPVDIHGPFHYVGIMDPLCGGTRAARYTAQGEWQLAWKYNPLGIVVVAGAAVLAARTLAGVLAGLWLTIQIDWSRRRWRWAIAVAATLLIILEVRQQLRADLLIAHT